MARNFKISYNSTNVICTTENLFTSVTEAFSKSNEIRVYEMLPDKTQRPIETIEEINQLIKE